MNIYGYARVSRDEDKENYDTIITQKSMIKKYAEEMGHKVEQIFEDDNISGYTFNRSGLNRLKKLIESKQVDILLIKDLSRLGRHNAKTLLFLEYLEEHDVRLILIHDNYDSGKDDDDIIGIKTWYNERYIKDLSRKIKANLNVKQNEGGLITKVAFGYIRDPEDKHRLIIDHEAASVVRKIFELYLDGNGGRMIANILNEEKIPTPSKYAYNKTGKKITGNIAEKWNGNHVIRIIKNDVYIGNLRCGKTERKKVNGKSYLTNEEEHIVYENHHKPIIFKEDFELAQEIIESRINNNVRGTSKGINLFTGFLKCGDCGSGFNKISKRRSISAYICGTNNLYGATACSSHKISEKQLIKIILDKLELMKNYIKENLEKLDTEINTLANFTKDYDKSIKKYKVRIEDKKEEIKNYSKQLARNIIQEELAAEMIQETNQELELLNRQLQELIKLKETSSEMKEKAINSLDIINEIIRSRKLKRRDLERIINRITIKQLSKPTHGLKPVLSIDIEWNVFISSIYNFINVYTNEYTLP